MRPLYHEAGSAGALGMSVTEALSQRDVMLCAPGTRTWRNGSGDVRRLWGAESWYGQPVWPVCGGQSHRLYLPLLLLQPLSSAASQSESTRLTMYLREAAPCHKGREIDS
jgi:hypothetical protein